MTSQLYRLRISFLHVFEITVKIYYIDKLNDDVRKTSYITGLISWFVECCVGSLVLNFVLNLIGLSVGLLTKTNQFIKNIFLKNAYFSFSNLNNCITKIKNLHLEQKEKERVWLIIKGLMPYVYAKTKLTNLRE